MKISTRWIFTCLALFLGITAKTQVQLHIANNYFKQHRFPSAIHFYTEAIKRKPTLEATQKLADCYRFTKDYNRAEFWYEKASGFMNSSASNLLNYGQMLKINEKYTQAKTVFEKYVTLPGVDISYAKSLISSCDSARAWLSEPEVIQIHNYSDINSVYSDYQPVKFGDSTYLFTTNRPTVQRKLGSLSKDQEMPFYKIVAAKIGGDGRLNGMDRLNIFGDLDQHIATPCFTKNQDTLYFTAGTFKKKNKERVNRLGIFYIIKSQSGWSKPIPFRFNNDDYSVAHPCISEDGTQLYFVSDMFGGFGGFDMYHSELINGQWTAPANMGAMINTSQDEFQPTLHNNRLFFSSNGHIGMGGLDIFSATQRDGAWSELTNLKPPFNSSHDDFGISFDPAGNFGFLSSNRTGGLGYDDIYRFDYDPGLSSENLLEIVVSYDNGAPTSGIDNIAFVQLSGDDTIPGFTMNGKRFYPLHAGQYYSAKVAHDGYLTVLIDSVNLADLKPYESTISGSISPKIINFFQVNAKLTKILYNHSYNLANIYYDLNKASLRPEAKRELDHLVDLLVQNPQLKVQIGSYCDSRGRDSYNLDLSQKRAESVVNYLISRGISASKLSSRGFGETHLVNKCDDGIPCSEEEHQANRRTDFQIIKESSPR